jgi:membrane protease YdiL (CAAX protease family)
VSWTFDALGVALGLLLVVATVAATRQLVQKAGWARALHAELRPAVAEHSDSALLVLALASGTAEELFFRGFVVPLLSIEPILHGLDGVVLAALIFGLLHQVRGRARWPWAAWACIMGIFFGLIVWVTGTLLGAVVAHVGINLANLRFLRDHDFSDTPPAQGARFHSPRRAQHDFAEGDPVLGSVPKARVIRALKTARS